MNHIPLFESQHLRFTPIDLEKDPKAIAAWTYELDIAARLREDSPARPMATFEIKKVYDRWLKEADDKQNQFIFAIHQRENETPEETPIMGVVRIKDIEWVHGAAYLDLIIANQEQWCQFAREALNLALHYAFDEMNLFRVTTVIAGHNEAANSLYEQANFTLEVRQRQAIYWNGRAWDKLFFGLLRPEWKVQQLAEVCA